MKKLLCLLPLLYVFNCFGQSKEEIISQCQLITGHKRFYIFKTAAPIKNHEIERLSGLIPDSIISQLHNNCLRDTLHQIWDCSSIKNARCLDISNIADYGKEHYYYFNQRDEQGNMVDERVTEVYSFSKPLFDNNRQYALIIVRHYKMGDCIETEYLLKRTKDHWVLLKDVVSWVIDN